ncbi:hypothetical protein GGI1_24966 [Acidithiobacillus sp. GGI-221]|nr:hypothetical protein GGI1_24966 [Acidithiobacillus sp. GGI-221]
MAGIYSDGRIDPYLATDCCIKQVNRRML